MHDARPVLAGVTQEKKRIGEPALVNGWLIGESGVRPRGFSRLVGRVVFPLLYGRRMSAGMRF